MKNFEVFLKESNLRLISILKKFDWNDVFKSFNTNMIEDIQDFPETELTFPTCYENKKNDILVLDKNELQKLLNNRNVTVPEKFSDLQINFTRDEKLQIYEHALKNRKVESQTFLQSDEVVSFADIFAMKKREKLKQRKHRISKPTYTEEVRSLVQLQMHALKEYLESKYEVKHTDMRNTTNLVDQHSTHKCYKSKKQNEDSTRGYRKRSPRSDRGKYDNNKKVYDYCLKNSCREQKRVEQSKVRNSNKNYRDQSRSENYNRDKDNVRRLKRPNNIKSNKK